MNIEICLGYFVVLNDFEFNIEKKEKKEGGERKCELSKYVHNILVK